MKELIQRDEHVLRMEGVGVESIGDGNDTLAAQAWGNRRDALAVKYDLNRTVKEEFERRGPKAAPALVERRTG